LAGQAFPAESKVVDDHDAGLTRGLFGIHEKNLHYQKRLTSADVTDQMTVSWRGFVTN